MNFAMLNLNPPELRHSLRCFMSPKRALHTLGVEDRAATLAMRWNQDIDKARLSALLHDITKECKNQLKLLEDYGILPSIWENSAPEVFHAFSGAGLAKALGAGDDICDAIRWHTTGRAGMGTLERILYLSDMTEPGRGGICGRRDLWQLCLTDLDRALHDGLSLSLNYIQSRNGPSDPRSAEALAWITERLQRNGEQRETH